MSRHGKSCESFGLQWTITDVRECVPLPVGVKQFLADVQAFIETEERPVPFVWFRKVCGGQWVGASKAGVVFIHFEEWKLRCGPRWVPEVPQRRCIGHAFARELRDVSRSSGLDRLVAPCARRGMGLNFPVSGCWQGVQPSTRAACEGGVTGLMGCEQLVNEPMQADDAASGG